MTADPPPLRPASEINTYSELVAAETAFREIVRSGIGSGWISDFAQDKIDGLEAKRTEEGKKRDGVAVSQDLLDYTEAYHLETLILKHWDKTGPILKDKKRAEVYLKLMLDFRNTIAHCRPVAPFERYLLAGIAGQVQNLISLHRSSFETADAYYASINYVRDSFGQEITGDAHRTPWGPARNRGRTRLQVGQVVTFECSATDPYDRDITWTYYVATTSSITRTQTLEQVQGATVTFAWTVDLQHVGEGRQLFISMSNNSPYKREGGSDATVIFEYNVSPPVPPRYG